MADPATALVVGDEEMTRAIMTGYLARIGSRTLEAATKADAWRILSGPDRVIHFPPGGATGNRCATGAGSAGTGAGSRVRTRRG